MKPTIIRCGLAAAILATSTLAQADTFKAPLPPPTLQFGASQLSEVLKPRRAEVRITQGAITRGDVFVSYPVDYRRTGVVTEDVTVYGKAAAPAGTPGYWAGRFSSAGLFGPRAPLDAWCFHSVREAKLHYVCFVDHSVPVDGKRMVSVIRQPNPFFISNIWSDALGQRIPKPNIEERAVSVVPDLRLEYAFGQWNAKDAEVWIHVGGQQYGAIRAPRTADGSAVVEAAGGLFRLQQPDPKNRRQATVSVVREPSPPPNS